MSSKNPLPQIHLISFVVVEKYIQINTNTIPNIIQIWNWHSLVMYFTRNYMHEITRRKCTIPITLSFMYKNHRNIEFTYCYSHSVYNNTQLNDRIRFDRADVNWFYLVYYMQTACLKTSKKSIVINIIEYAKHIAIKYNFPLFQLAKLFVRSF